MSKLYDALKKAQKTHLGEQNKFCDSLADFINSNSSLIRDGDHLRFYIRCLPRGGDFSGVTTHGVTFIPCMDSPATNYQKLSSNDDDIRIRLPEKTILNMLESIYHARVQKTNWAIFYEIYFPLDL